MDFCHSPWRHGLTYSRVLKKREARLKREQDGLKSLIAGLVGGPALLKEWEREWRERFGGEEKDELEEEPVKQRQPSPVVLSTRSKSSSRSTKNSSKKKKRQDGPFLKPPRTTMYMARYCVG